MYIYIIVQHSLNADCSCLNGQRAHTNTPFLFLFYNVHRRTESIIRLFAPERILTFLLFVRILPHTEWQNIVFFYVGWTNAREMDPFTATSDHALTTAQQTDGRLSENTLRTAQQQQHVQHAPQKQRSRNIPTNANARQ